jgi:alpha-tubulin suppressor-like RCC1 family protein
MMKRVITVILCLIIIAVMLPVTVSAQGEAGSIVSAGGDVTLVIKKDGSLWGAGRNNFGQLGLGHEDVVAQFTKIMDGAASVSAANYHTVVVKRDGTLWAFGRKIGGPFEKDTATPVQVLDNVKMAAAGTYYTAAVKTDGTLWIYGNMSTGNGEVNRIKDQFVKAMDGVKAVFAGDDNCLVIKNDDSLWSWGVNTCGQIGDGTTGEAVLVATKVMDDVATAAAGVGIMAIRKDGSLWMWGTGSPLPTENGELPKSTVPVKVMDNALSCCMSAGNKTYFVLKRDGTVLGAGSGHVLTGLTSSSTQDSFVKITDNAVAISSESRHLAVVKTDLTLWTGGQSINGRLGYGNADKYDAHPLTKVLTDVLDVPAPWALSEVREAEYRKLVPPELQSEYTKTVTRSEFCTLAVICVEQAKQMTVEQYIVQKGLIIPETSPFTDISGVSERARADILAAYALGIVAGTSATTFDPTKLITREQAAKMLTAAAAALGESTDVAAPAFADSAQISSWALPYIGYVFDAKIMGGVGANKFDPQGGYQRQQAYMTMLRLYKHVTGIA